MSTQQMQPLNDRLLKAIGKSKGISEKVDTGTYTKGNINSSAIPIDDGSTQYLDNNQATNNNKPREVSESKINNEIQQKNRISESTERVEKLKKSKIPNAIKESFIKKPPIVGQTPSGADNIGAADAERMRTLMGESVKPEAKPTSQPTQNTSGTNNVLNELSSYGLKAVINEAIENMVPQIINEVKKAEKETYDEMVGGDKIGVRIGDQIFICEVLKVKDVK